MPTISNLKLSIKKGKLFSDVTVTYDICFSKCELLAGSTFVQRVVLRGDDSPFADDHLITIYSGCVNAKSRCEKQKISRKVLTEHLNEDDFWFNRRDEVYARVLLTPFMPGSAAADSNIVYGWY